MAYSSSLLRCCPAAAGASFASSQLAREMLKELRCKQRNLLRSAAPREVAQVGACRGWGWGRGRLGCCQPLTDDVDACCVIAKCSIHAGGGSTLVVGLVLCGARAGASVLCGGCPFTRVG